MLPTPQTGQIEDGYRFLGGDPASEKNWEPQAALKPGDIEGGYRFLGGDPASEKNWDDTSKSIWQRASDFAGKVASDEASGLASWAKSLGTPAHSVMDDYKAPEANPEADQSKVASPDILGNFAPLRKDYADKTLSLMQDMPDDELAKLAQGKGAIPALARYQIGLNESEPANPAPDEPETPTPLDVGDISQVAPQTPDEMAQTAFQKPASEEFKNQYPFSSTLIGSYIRTAADTYHAVATAAENVGDLVGNHTLPGVFLKAYGINQLVTEGQQDLYGGKLPDKPWGEDAIAQYADSFTPDTLRGGLDKAKRDGKLGEYIGLTMVNMGGLFAELALSVADPALVPVVTGAIAMQFGGAANYRDINAGVTKQGRAADVAVNTALGLVRWHGMQAANSLIGRMVEAGVEKSVATARVAGITGAIFQQGLAAAQMVGINAVQNLSSNYLAGIPTDTMQGWREAAIGGVALGIPHAAGHMAEGFGPAARNYQAMLAADQMVTDRLARAALDPNLDDAERGLITSPYLPDVLQKYRDAQAKVLSDETLSPETPEQPATTSPPVGGNASPTGEVPAPQAAEEYNKEIANLQQLRPTSIEQLLAEQNAKTEAAINSIETAKQDATETLNAAPAPDSGILNATTEEEAAQRAQEALAKTPPATPSVAEAVKLSLPKKATIADMSDEQLDNHIAAIQQQVNPNIPSMADLVLKMALDEKAGRENAQAAQASIPVVEIPVDRLSLSGDVPQFKSDANSSGIVEPLGGKYERIGTAPILVWQRLSGALEVISGRHRFELAQRTGEETIPAHIVKESEGFTAKDAAKADAELNIRDNQGKAKDYVQYFKATGISKETAESRGLLARGEGKRAFAIATDGSEELAAAHRGDAISTGAAYTIALNAPNNPKLQAVGIKAAMDGKSDVDVANLVKAVSVMGGNTPQSMDMFGFDSSAMKQAEQMAAARAKQREATVDLLAIKGVAKNPKAAKKYGVDAKDPVALAAKVEELKARKAAWDNWQTNPELIAEIKAAIQPSPEPTQPQTPADAGVSVSATEPAQPFALNQHTEESLRQQEAVREQAGREEEAYIRAQAAERGARDQADIDARTEARTANPDNFTFGESSKDAAKPMGDLFNQPEKPAAETTSSPEQQAIAILDRANVTGKDRLDIMRDFKDGKHTLADLDAAYPAAAKEPWQMTQAEWFDHKWGQISKKAQKSIIAGEKGFVGVNDIRRQADNEHQRNVESAIAQGKPVPAEVLADYPDLAKQTQAGQPADDYFHYTNGNLGMTSSGSFTADKSRWITFTREEALDMGGRDVKPAYATKRGLFVGTESGERIKQETGKGAAKFSIRSPAFADNRAEQIRLIQDKLDTDRADAELRYETGDRVDPETGAFYGGGGAGYSRGERSEANNFKTNEANREQTDALEKTIQRGGHDFTVTPVSLPFDLAARRDTDYNAAQKIAKIFGKKVVWMRADGDFPINGVIDTANPKSVFIDVRSAVPTHSVLGHELTHHMEIEAPEVYADLLNTLNGIIRGHDDYRAQNKIPAKMSERGVTKEIVGDLMGDSFRDPAFWDRVGQQNPSVLGRIADVVRKWLNNLILRATGKGYGSEQFVTDAKAAREALAKAVAKYAESAHEKVNGQGEPLFDTAHADTFYSQLMKTVRDTPDRIFSTGKQVAAWLQANAAKLEVKKDELHWTGVLDWLNTQGKVSKADVLEYLKGNGVKVEEVTLGKSEDVKLTEKILNEKIERAGFPITSEMRTKATREGLPLFSKSRAVTQGEYEAKQEQKGATGLLDESRSAADKVKDGLKELYGAWKSTPEYGDMERIKGTLLGKNQEVDFDVDRQFKKINLEIPAPRQRAITQYMQAGGDEAVLKERIAVLRAKGIKRIAVLRAKGIKWIAVLRAKGIKEKYIAPFEDALKLPEGDKAAAKAIYAEQQKWGEKAVEAGILEHLLDNYVRGQWERESQGGKRLAALANSGILNEHPREAMRKVFQNDFEGILAGFVPVDPRIGYQHGMAQAAIRKAINAHEALRDMMTAKARDGMPVTLLGAGGVNIVDTNENVIARRAEVEEARKALNGDPHNKALQKALDAKRDALDEAVKAGEADLKDKAYFIKPNMPPKGAVTPDGRSYVEYDHPALRGWKWVGKDVAGNPISRQGNMWVHPDAVGDIHALLGRSVIRDYAIPKDIPIIGGTHPGAAALKASAYVKATILAAVPAPFHLFHVGEHAVFHDTNPLTTRPLDFDRTATIGGKEYQILREGVNHGLMLYGHNALQEFGEGLSSGGLFKHVPYWGEMVHNFGEWQFKKIIPQLKAEMFEKAVLRDVAHSQKELKAGTLTMDQIFQRQAKHSNDAFGEQNCKYLGRDPTLQDAFKLLGLAPDFLESRMKFAGAALTPSGREQRIALIKGALIMGIGAQIINLMFGDDHKTHWDRPFSVIIGGREYTPRSVVGDIAHLYNDPRSWFYSRINPLTVRPAIELASGRNQFEQKETTEDAMVNIIKSWSPIPVQGLYKNTQGQTQLQAIVGQLLQSIGISNKQARTPAEKLILDINFDRRPAGIETPMTKKRYMEYGELKDDYMSGKLNSMNDVRARAREDGVILSKNQLDAIRHSHDTTPQAKEKILEAKMKHFSAEQAMMVWDKADQDERKMLRNFIYNKVNNSQNMAEPEKHAARKSLGY